MPVLHVVGGSWTREAWAALSRAAAELTDAVYPRACHLCGAAAAGWACDAHALPPRPALESCGRCGAALPAGFPDGFPCASCRRAPPSFARLVALAEYGPDAPVREWVLAFKHGGRRDLARPLGAALAARVREVGDAAGEGAEPAPLVPVPTHLLRRMERGYDHARLLAEALGRAVRAPVRRALVRLRATPVQGAPGSPPRRANVRGAFAVDAGEQRHVAGRTVWLVDDVVTSGATADECARTLRRAGAARVLVACLARARTVGPASGPASMAAPERIADTLAAP